MVIVPAFLSKKETIFEGFSEPYLRTSRPKEASGLKKVFTTKIAKNMKQCGIIWGKTTKNSAFLFTSLHG